jgi:hypothetical protein
MILTASLKLEAILAGTVSASQPEVHVDYVDWTVEGVVTRPATFRVALNNANDVTILAAPSSNNTVREPVRVIIYNKDTSSITVTVKTDDGVTEFIEVKQTVVTLKSLCWEKSVGWYQI